MGKRKIAIRHSVAESIAEISWFIESKGMVKTAIQFSDSAYDFIEKLANPIKSYRFCRDPERLALGFNALLSEKSIQWFLLRWRRN